MWTATVWFLLNFNKKLFNLITTELIPTFAYQKARIYGS